MGCSPFSGYPMLLRAIDDPILRHVAYHHNVTMEESESDKDCVSDVESGESELIPSMITTVRPPDISTTSTTSSSNPMTGSSSPIVMTSLSTTLMSIMTQLNENELHELENILLQLDLIIQQKEQQLNTQYNHDDTDNIDSNDIDSDDYYTDFYGIGSSQLPHTMISDEEYEELLRQLLTNSTLLSERLGQYLLPSSNNPSSTSGSQTPLPTQLTIISLTEHLFPSHTVNRRKKSTSNLQNSSNGKKSCKGKIRKTTPAQLALRYGMEKGIVMLTRAMTTTSSLVTVSSPNNPNVEYNAVMIPIKQRLRENFQSLSIPPLTQRETRILDSLQHLVANPGAHPIRYKPGHRYSVNRI